ncbi:MAG: exodeoxyribonuclease VII small subunit [Gemmatimonadetes bacterium]|nr:MAG: exodeoxyribonuclease VII small subunit [Gemmatimonadota bacterium]
MKVPSFEDQLNRLEEIAGSLDRVDVPLDKALALFEEGIQRLRAAQATLEAAEGRLRELVERADGTLEPTEGKLLGSADGDDED